MTSDRRNPILDLTTEEKNKIIGDAIDAWLEKKWAAFGKWTLRGVLASAFGMLIYFISTHGGKIW
jgi:hypothetical protein